MARPAARSSPTRSSGTTGRRIRNGSSATAFHGIYQDIGVGLDAAGFWGWTDNPYIGNYGDNSLLYFHQYQNSNPEVWSKTVFLINFDEEGGFFDHMVPPTPPRSREEGISTVDITNEIFPGDATHPSGPYGLGMRVPMFVISPWSRGGWVNSQLFDHTSTIRFIEARFAKRNRDLIETNITPWRRAVVGDLTTAFDFANPEAWRKVKLPSTAAYKPTDFERHPDEEPVPPTQQILPAQEQGVRPARALPYALHVHGSADPSDDSFRIEFRNIGRAAAAFQVRSGSAADAPRTYNLVVTVDGDDRFKYRFAGHVEDGEDSGDGAHASPPPASELQLGAAQRNAYLESFMLHSRNLVRFLFAQDAGPADVVAADFCQDSWQPQPNPLLAAANDRFQKELSPLTTGQISGSPSRKRWEVERLDAEVRPLLGEFIERASPARLSPKVRTLITSR
jgi:hypothetical protein